MLSRRTVNLGILASVGLAADVGRAVAADLKVVDLPQPWKDGGKPLAQAVWARRSIREFADKPVPLEVLSNLLWTACGVNRPATGDRTMPSWRHAMDAEIFVAAADGAWSYDAKAHRLTQALADDIRAETGVQDFVGTAPIDLIYVCRRRAVAGRRGRRETPMGVRRRRLHRPERLPVLRLRGAGDGVPRLAESRPARANAATAADEVRHLRADGRLSEGLIGLIRFPSE